MLQVRVHHHENVAPRERHAVQDCAAQTIARLLAHQQTQREVSGGFGAHLRRVVMAAVVNNDDLVAPPRMAKSSRRNSSGMFSASLRVGMMTEMSTCGSSIAGNCIRGKN